MNKNLVGWIVLMVLSCFGYSYEQISNGIYGLLPVVWSFANVIWIFLMFYSSYHITEYTIKYTVNEEITKI